MRLGVDFGTSHTVAVLAYPDGRTKSMLFDDGTPLLRSAVYADGDGTIQVGRDAVRRAGLDPTRYEPNPKQRIDEQSVLLGDGEYKLTDLFAAVLGRVVSEVRRVAGSIPSDVVMTYPAAWGARRREILTTAAAQAGLHNVRLIPEPVGAAVYFTSVLGHQVADGRPLGVFDFGGGTLDVAVVRRDGNTFTVLSTGGLPDLGGVDLDSALVDHLGQLIAQRDPALWRRLANPETSNDRRARQLLWDDVRGAKESLSRTTSAPVNVPETDTDLHLTRDEFERLTTPLLARAIAETQRVIREARIEPAQLSGLFLVGGSSRVPLVARMLHSGLGVPPTVLEQPEVAVAEGAAKLGAAKNPQSAPTPPPPRPPASGPPMNAPTPPPSNRPMSAAPMSAPPVSPAPMSTPPMSNRPMSAPPVSSPPVSSIPVTPAPRPYSPPQPSYSPPPPRPPVLPPVQQHRPPPPRPMPMAAPAPPPPQVIQVPYAVPVPHAPQPVVVRRRRSKTGWIILLVLVGIVGFCCYGTLVKPSIMAGLLGRGFVDAFDQDPKMHGGEVPYPLSGFFDSWKPALNECWTTQKGAVYSGPITTGFNAITDKIDGEVTWVLCTFDDDIKSEFGADSIIFIDNDADGGGQAVEDKFAEIYGLKDPWNGSGKSGLDEYQMARTVISGDYTAGSDDAFALSMSSVDSKTTVAKLTDLFQAYSK
ncbi:hypothetical protein Afil01_08710 [Actinorhabdospora filicis]|uniref:Hsp70 protein n=1 Tax=Actinorhabdospora filicis TaxID=1785913 RepID=A0A9W6SF69_9ACTN|nr:Hsp70 family protein [Actinorhabdospora filicis]GLZ76064.1 hypothetical protein Afil01_08710 [Actinorhabdospora filicis]